MNIQLRTKRLPGNAIVVEVEGDVDVFTADHLTQALDMLMERGFLDLIVNLEDVQLLDTSGLGALVAARKKASELGGSLGLVFVNPHIRKIFELTGLVRLFEIHSDEVDASLSHLHGKTENPTA